ncbi:MAG: DUF1207 domain-containing protein [Planctomycetota bacterium]|nr:MAG: DUF1207 domain-containing protein [Planctomycetota bacterium]
MRRISSHPCFAAIGSGLLWLVVAPGAVAQSFSGGDPFLAQTWESDSATAQFSPHAPLPDSTAVFAPGAAAPWTWHLLPDDLVYRSYLGSPHEPRLTSAILHESDAGWLWELEVGTRVGLVRYGTPDGARPPEGWQIDIQGAAFPRLNLERNYDLDAIDFEVGLPVTWRRGPLQTKFELRHISSHVGDEFLERNPGFMRANYVRDSLVFGVGMFPTPDVRVYGEADYAFNYDGGAEPWHFQFGVDYSPTPVVEWLGWHGTPFAAVNGELREEVDFGGGFNAVAGWQLRGPQSGRLFRFGLQYYNGKSLQFSFFDQHEELFGAAIWYDY